MGSLNRISTCILQTYSQTLVNPYIVGFHAKSIGGYGDPLETDHFSDSG